MAGKRTASSDLNHDNWDQDDEVEYAGTFQKAPEDVLKQRIIKTAKRRNPQCSTDESGNKSAFGSFTGFQKFAPPNPNKAFNFLSNTNTTTLTSTGVAKVGTGDLTNGTNSKEKSTVSSSETSLKVIPDTSETNKADNEKTEYYAKLKGLNESVLSWIDKHVKENPFINLKPIFVDYERHLTDLDSKYVSVSKETKKELTTFSFKKSPNDVSSKSEATIPSIFGGSSGNTNFSKPPTSKENESTTTPSFVFGSASASKSATPGTEQSKPFTFGASSSTGSTIGASFMSNSSKPFTFTSTTIPTSAPPAKEVGTDGGEANEDEPPKVEFTPVVEENYLYSIRCKVFVKKDESFGERGVGNLYLKQVPDSEKVQLIVRADTNLGNLLCNFILSESLPIRRMGKKDVIIVCIPTPETKPPPVPLLFRVKTTEDAEALYSALDKHKK